MVFRTLESDLSANGMDNLVKQLGKLSKDMANLNDNFLEISLDYLMERAIARLGQTTGQGTYPLTGELVNSFNAYREPNRGILRNEAFHAAVVEFGSGIVGQMSPHEWAAELGIVYDANMHGEDGWTYKGDDGNYYHTIGMEPHYYMYSALMDYMYGGGKEQCMRKALESLR